MLDLGCSAVAPCTNVAFADVDVTVPSGSAPSYVCVNAVNVTGVPNSGGECSSWQEPQRLVVIRGFLIATRGRIYISAQPPQHVRSPTAQGANEEPQRERGDTTGYNKRASRASLGGGVGRRGGGERGAAIKIAGDFRNGRL